MDFSDKKFQRLLLEGYLGAVILILTFLAYMILGGIGFRIQTNYVVLSLLLMVLISVNILHTMISIRVLNELDDED